MKVKTTVLAVLCLMLACCGHKLIVDNGQHSVAMYPDEATYLRISQLRQQGGVQGMLGDVGQNLAAKQIDGGTPVRILSSSSNGSMVEITGGPMKGQSGFVAKKNLD